MCLVVLAIGANPRFPLVVLSNRDEVYDRPSAPAHAWSDEDIFAGRDLREGGTWLGVRKTQSGNSFSLVTNVRSPSARRTGKSRGLVVRRTLSSGFDFSADELEAFPAFNLLFGGVGGVYYANESGQAPALLGPGVHGLSNARMDVPWPKVTRTERALTELLGERDPSFDVDRALAALRDDARADENELPDTGVGKEWESALSSPFIALPGYGTRASTVLVYEADGTLRFTEQGYGPSGVSLGRVSVTLP